MAVMVWIDLQVKDGNRATVDEMMKSPQGIAFTKSQTCAVRSATFTGVA